jgi:hypothetical protein
VTVRLFSYGTLQQPALQKALFGRELTGRPDRLPGYRQTMLAITDPDVIAASGSAEHPIARWTGAADDHIDGTALDLTDEELAAADAYEVDDYTRALVRLASGDPAWVYAAGHAPATP